MVASKDRTRNYNPTTTELTQTIDHILAEHPGADWKEVHATIYKEQPAWKLPERRVAKFVKRNQSPTYTEDSGSVVSNTTSSSMGSVRKFLRERKERKAERKEARSNEAAATAATTHHHHQGENHGDNVSVISTASSQRSIRKLLFSRHKKHKEIHPESSSSNRDEKPPTASVTIVTTETKVPNPAPTSSPAAAATTKSPKLSELANAAMLSPKAEDEKISKSKNTIRRFLKQRKAKRASQKAKKALAAEQKKEDATSKQQQSSSPGSQTESSPESSPPKETILPPVPSTIQTAKEEPHRFQNSPVRNIIITTQFKESNVETPSSPFEEKKEEEPALIVLLTKEEPLPQSTPIDHPTQSATSIPTKSKDLDASVFATKSENSGIAVSMTTVILSHEHGFSVYRDENLKNEEAALCEGCVIL